MNTAQSIAKSERLSRWLDSRMDGVAISPALRYRVAGACVDQAMEHQKAVVLLVKRKLYGSAFALVRSIFESYVRGVWLHQCATDAEVRKYQRETLRLEFGSMLKALEQLEAFDSGILSATKQRSWKAMNSFTHTGFSQAVRRNTESSIEPNYEESEILEALSFANAMALLAAGEVAHLARDEALAMAVLKKTKRFAPMASNLSIERTD